MIERARKRLSKRAKKGFRGWPVATVALYGPDDSTATKLTVGIMPAEDAEASDLRRWFSKDQTDIRHDIRVTEVFIRSRLNQRQALTLSDDGWIALPEASLAK